MNNGSPSFDVIGLGRSYIDVIGVVPHTFLERHGIPISESRYFDARDIAAIHAEIDAPQLSSGGAIPNTIAGLAALGARTGYIGNVADDALGRPFLADLAASSIADLGSNPLPAPAHSGTCLVLITPDGERHFALHKGCVDHFDEAKILGFDYTKTRTLTLGANLLTNESKGALVAHIMEKAAGQCRLAVSLSQVHDWRGREDFARGVIAHHSDLLIGNEAEVAALKAVSGFSISEKTTLIITKGARGASAFYQNQEATCPATTHATFVNTLGAGDQFLAGYLMGEILERTPQECLSLGVRCADAIIQRTEARPKTGENWSHLR